MDQPDFTARASKTADVLALFKSRPGEWIDWSEFAKVGGACAWRTRIADARKIVTAEGGKVENRQRRQIAVERDTQKEPQRMYFGAVISEYRYTAYVPLGRAADVEPSDQPALFDLGVR